MTRFRFWLICGVLWSSLSHAFTYQILFPPAHVQPVTGLWWSPGENGQFLQLAIGPGGYGLATLTDSHPDGSPRYRVLQGALALFDATISPRLAWLQSPLYEVRDSACLECGAGNGRTVDTGSVLTLEFTDGTHAVLRSADQRVLRQYGRFPLLTRAEDTLSERLDGHSFLLTATANGQRAHAIVRLAAARRDDRCQSISAGERSFALEFADGSVASGLLARQFANAWLQVGPGINPALDLKTLTNDGRCTSAYRMHEADAGGLRGAARAAVSPLSAGSGTSYFSRALTLQPLPTD